MKRIAIISALVIAGAAGSVSAATMNPSALPSIDAAMVQHYLPNANLTSLTPSKVAQIQVILNGSKKPGENIGGQLMDLLGQA